MNRRKLTKNKPFYFICTFNTLHLFALNCHVFFLLWNTLLFSFHFLCFFCFRHWLTNAWARVGVAYYFYDTLVKMQCTFHEYGDPKRELNIFYKVFLFLKHDPLMFFHHIILPPLIYPCILVSYLRLLVPCEFVDLLNH